jgi:hypothetical protein
VNWDHLDLAFWHPFGPYCGLSEEAILRWKSDEVERHRWTFWSFAYAPTAAKWSSVLREHSGPIHVLCSYSPTAQDPFPNAKPRRATHYRFLNESIEWQAMPSGDGVMFVTNPFKRQGLATAFKITRVEVLHPPVTPAATVEWFARGQEQWSSRDLPTRGEFLVRRGGKANLRQVCAVLECSPPYLAELQSR